MADVKISALPAATTPVAGTEVLPIVQSSTTKQVSIANLTAGRALSASSLTLTSTPLAVGSGGTGFSSLTAGYIPFGAGTSALGSSSNLFWDNTNAWLGVGTTSPDTKVTINGDLRVIGGNIYANANNTSALSIYGGGAYNKGAGIILCGESNSGAPNAFIFYNSSFTERMRIDASGNCLIGTTAAGASKLVVNDNSIQINTAKTPASASAAGTQGQVCWDSSYIYVCTATNTWKRAAIASW